MTATRLRLVSLPVQHRYCSVCGIALTSPAAQQPIEVYA